MQWTYWTGVDAHTGRESPLKPSGTQPQGRASGLAAGSRESVEIRSRKKTVLAAQLVSGASRTAPPQIVVLLYLKPICGGVVMSVLIGRCFRCEPWG